MARRNSNTATEKPAEAPVETPAETPTEAPAEGTTETTTESAPDLTAFNTVVNEVVETRDTSTGELSEEGKARITAAYRELDATAKRAAKPGVEERMMEAVQALDGPLARAFADAKNALVAGGSKSSGDRTPADPTAAYVQKVASHRLALSLVEGNRPENLAEDFEAQIEKLIADSGELVEAQQKYLADESEDKGDGPELSPVVRTAFKLAQGKASGGGRQSGGSGPRGDIGKHIQEVFAELAPGTELKISEVAKVKTSEYPQGNASQGAITARLFGKDGGKTHTVTGVEAVAKDDSGPNRVRKVA